MRQAPVHNRRGTAYRSSAYAKKVQRLAYNAVRRAIGTGALVRPGRCGRCWKRCKPDAHHSDYFQPLAVEWLCNACHGLANFDRDDSPDCSAVVPIDDIVRCFGPRPR